MVKEVPIALAYAATSVNSCIFRVNALITHGRRQYLTFYDPAGSLIVAARNLDDDSLDIANLHLRCKVNDGHNGACLGISSDGQLHLAYDHHNNPLHYRVTRSPGDIRSFGPEQPMTGALEARVTYPTFVNDPNGELFFFYRDGGSGNGRLCVNHYDASERKWRIIQHGLIDGTSRRVTANPYWCRPAFAADGTLHLGWCWRRTPKAETNYHFCYVKSPDAGRTWLRSDNSPQPIPITPDNAQVIDPIPEKSNLINTGASAVDPQGRPHFVHYHNDSAQIPQYFHLHLTSRGWQRTQVSRRTSRFSLSGGGTLRIPVSRPEIAVSPDGRACVITRDEEFGGGVRLYLADAPYTTWKPLDVRAGYLGNWEPTYDPVRFSRDNILSLFLLATSQGNHETVTGFPPQLAAVFEIHPASLPVGALK